MKSSLPVFDIIEFCRSSPKYEADYLELAKDLQTIELPKKQSISIYGPNAFPVVTKNEAYAYVAAGNYGTVILRNEG